MNVTILNVAQLSIFTRIESLRITGIFMFSLQPFQGCYLLLNYDFDVPFEDIILMQMKHLQVCGMIKSVSLSSNIKNGVCYCV